jgi:hypothetical protein
MAKRLKIALIYSYNEDWIAGAYYILNLIHALNKQKDPDKPELVILSENEKDFDSVKAIQYPYIKFKRFEEQDLWTPYRFTERLINKASRILTGKNIIQRTSTYKRLKINTDALFPASDNAFFFKIKNKIFWIPDLVLSLLFLVVKMP